MINEDVPIKTKVYRKETHMYKYVNFNSNHPLERGSEDSNAQSGHYSK